MKKILVIMIALLFLLAGCNTVIYEKPIGDDSATEYDLTFKEEDLDYSYSSSSVKEMSYSGNSMAITSGGTYLLEGEINGSVIIEVPDDEEVTLVLNGVTVNSGNFAAIYVIEADQITITLAEGSVNYLKDSGTYKQIDDNDVDAIIYSKADLVLNGTGTLNIETSNHGIVSKDDLIITGGTFNINASGQGIRGKDCVKISDGSFTITSGKDAIKSDNEDDAYRGYVYITGGTFKIDTYADAIYGYNLVNISGGSFNITTSKSNTADSYKGIKSDYSVYIEDGDITINSYDDGIHSDGDIEIKGGNINVKSSDDGIHADGIVQIDGGKIEISASEGIEGTYIIINDGTIYISATDDGINAGQKVSQYTPTVEINGGNITIVMGQGDTDGIDSNGYIYINGGNINISGQSPFDYDMGAEYTGGTITVNGVETNEITNQMMGGGMGGQEIPGMGGKGTDPNSGNNGNSQGGYGSDGRGPGGGGFWH